MAEVIGVQVSDASDLDSQDVPSPERIRLWAEAALGAQQGKGLCIRIVGREEGRSLNASFRETDRATNVLAFPVAGTLDTELDLLGDIAICAPVVRDEAPEKDQRQGHWAHMVVHGVLHLLGYDHQTDDEAKEMECREQAILSGLGFSCKVRQGEEN